MSNGFGTGRALLDWKGLAVVARSDVRGRTKRVFAILLLLGGLLTTLTFTSASPASAGGNGWMWIGYDSSIHTQQVTGVPAWYHMDVWNDGFGAVTHGDYWYNPGTTYNDHWWTIPSGATACAQLWHWTGSSWISEGLACYTRP